MAIVLPPDGHPDALAAHDIRPARTPVRAEPTAPVLSVVVVNFRQPENTLDLTRHLDHSDSFRAGSAEIVIVDNDRRSAELRRRVRRWPGVTIRSMGQNRGFARAANEGCRQSRGQWMLLLNPDVRIPDEFLDQVLSAAERLVALDPSVGVIGYELRHGDDSAQASAGPFPTLWNVLTGLIRSRSKRRCRPLNAAGPVPVEWVTGCCQLVRRECWQELGGFDEDFFLYYEDADLCRRARSKGWSVWFDPAVRVTHHQPLHVRKVPSPLRLITRHALLTYAAKHWPEWQFNLLSRLIRLESRVRGWAARWSGQRESAKHLERIRNLAGDMLAGRPVRARQRVMIAARSLEGP